MVDAVELNRLFWHSRRGMLELEAVRDSLYRQIRQMRGDIPRELSPHWEGLKDTRRRLVRIVPWWMVALFTLACLGVIYGGFAWVLGEQREAVLQPYRVLDMDAGGSTFSGMK